MRVVHEQRAARGGGEADAAALDRMTAAIVENFNNQMDAFHTSARVLDDGIIDPRDTREGAGDLRWRSAARRSGERPDRNPVRGGAAMTTDAVSASCWSPIAARSRCGCCAARARRACEPSRSIREADADAPHVALADEAVCIGKAAPRDSPI